MVTSETQQHGRSFTYVNLELSRKKLTQTRYCKIHPTKIFRKTCEFYRQNSTVRSLIDSELILENTGKILNIRTNNSSEGMFFQSL